MRLLTMKYKFKCMMHIKHAFVSLTYCYANKVFSKLSILSNPKICGVLFSYTTIKYYYLNMQFILHGSPGMCGYFS